jgi:hypothetical protein
MLLEARKYVCFFSVYVCYYFTHCTALLVLESRYGWQSDVGYWCIHSAPDVLGLTALHIDLYKRAVSKQYHHVL